MGGVLLDSPRDRGGVLTLEQVGYEHGIDLGRLDEKQIIEREQAAGVAFGPVHRHYLIRRAPRSARRMLRKAALNPELTCAKTGFASGDDIFNLAQGFPNASLKTINTTTTETNLWDPNVLFRIPGGSMAAGKTYVAEFGGVMGTTGTPTVAWRARCGTNNSAPPTGTDLGVGPTVTLGTITAQPFFGRFIMGVRDAGVAASLIAVAGSGFAALPAAAAATATPTPLMGGALPTTIDGSVDQGLAVSMAWGASSASNTLTCQWMLPFTIG